jgi:hypothetical protein
VSYPACFGHKASLLSDFPLDCLVRAHESILAHFAGRRHRVEDSPNVVGNALPGVPNRESSTGQLSTGTSVTLVAGTEGATVSAATPLPVQAGRVALRRRFQKGTLIIRGKKPTRCGVYREDVLQPNGTFKRVQRCVVLGPVSSLSERAAWKFFQPHLGRVNANSLCYDSPFL